MNGSKRSLNSSKNSSKVNGKLRDSLSTSSTSMRYNKNFDSRTSETDFLSIPLIKISDNAEILPTYAAIAAKPNGEEVSMDDLDKLQQEFEKLLNVCALRVRHLKGEGRIGTDFLKRRRIDIPRLLDNKTIQNSKKQCVPTKYYNIFNEVPKATSSRNDHSDKFWASIEPYCAPATKDDVAFLDRLIQECSKEINVKIPDIEEHYASAWSEEIINDEQNNLGKTQNKKSLGIDFKKNGMQELLDTFSMASSGDEQQLKLVNETENSNFKELHKLKSSEYSKLKQCSQQKIGLCLEEGLQRVLVEQGILKSEDVKSISEDEVLSEIKKCQEELASVNAYNIEELTKLKNIVVNDIHCNELKTELEKVDRQILKLYNKIISQQEEKKWSNSKQGFAEFEQQAEALLRQQSVLNQEINNLSDMSLLY